MRLRWSVAVRAGDPWPDIAPSGASGFAKITSQCLSRETQVFGLKESYADVPHDLSQHQKPAVEAALFICALQPLAES
jgi:hypothetical protein